MMSWTVVGIILGLVQKLYLKHVRSVHYNGRIVKLMMDFLWSSASGFFYLILAVRSVLGPSLHGRNNMEWKSFTRLVVKVVVFAYGLCILFWKGQYNQSYSNVHGIMAGEFPAACMETSIHRPARIWMWFQVEPYLSTRDLDAQRAGWICCLPWKKWNQSRISMAFCYKAGMLTSNLDKCSISCGKACEIIHSPKE
jgi:hypothetical protein